MGIEPTPSAWKADILTIIRYLHKASFNTNLIGVEPTNVRN